MSNIENSEISEICLFFQILAVVITKDLKTTKIWTEQKTERFWYKLKEKRKTSEISEFSTLTYTQDRKLGNLGNFVYFEFLTLVVTQDLKTPEKWSETKTKRFRYDLEQKRKFPRFPSFRFCLIPKIENSEI